MLSRACVTSKRSVFVASLTNPGLPRMTALNTIQERIRQSKFHQSMIAVRRIRKSLVDAYPSMLLRLNRGKREALASEFRRCATVEDCIDFTRRRMAVGSCQIPWEIDSAISLIASKRPRIMCEIGTLEGGTSLLFCRFLQTLEAMLCIDLYVKNKELLKLLAPSTQQLLFFDMPSSSPDSLNTVAKSLNGRRIDVLFIDGDHRYEGVKQDFLSYRPFVSEGGLILFHDIVEDHGGKAWVGGVPKLWREVSSVYPHTEFVNSRGQDGFGIGVLTYSAWVQLPVTLHSPSTGLAAPNGGVTGCP